MSRLAIVALVLFAGLQQQQDNPRHDRYANDPNAYCYNLKTSGSMGARRQRDKSAHACACHLICQRNYEGEIVGDQESPDCGLYCTRDRCLCHPESPCEGHH